MEDGEHQSLLQRARLKRQWSRRALATLLGVSVSAIVRWEGGQTPYKYHQEKLCALFGMSAEQLGFIPPPMEEPAPVQNTPLSAAPSSVPLTVSKEHPSTYFVQDRSSMDEMRRLAIQDTLYTQQMGGVLPEQSEPGRFRRMLDVGCGTGNWLIETAKTYPTISLLVGVDISGKMIEYARERADAEGVGQRVQFHVMDALRMLEFPSEYFDLINQRLGMSYLRTWDWPKLLSEYKRVSKRGGTVRITEGGLTSTSSSPTLVHFNNLFASALQQAGHHSSDGVTTQLPMLLERICTGVQTHIHNIEFEFSTPSGYVFVDNVRRLYKNAEPFLKKWIALQDFEALYRQLLLELDEPKGFMRGELVTAWGTIPI